MTPTLRKASVEEKILQTARRLFCQAGIHATGIARIIEESGVSRRSLYTHYGSKENLLKAVFETEANMWFHWFDSDLSQMERSADERILALFDLMQECANAHRDKITTKLVAMVTESGARDPELVTEKLNLLIDGTIVAAMVTGDGKIAHIGKQAAADILRCAK